MTLRILVTGSDLFFTARLIHDLGKHGVTVTAADSSWCSAGKMSRAVSRRLTVKANAYLGKTVKFETESFDRNKAHLVWGKRRCFLEPFSLRIIDPSHRIPVLRFVVVGDFNPCHLNFLHLRGAPIATAIARRSSLQHIVRPRYHSPRLYALLKSPSKPTKYQASVATARHTRK